jgi:hypothetical protein
MNLSVQIRVNLSNELGCYFIIQESSGKSLRVVAEFDAWMDTGNK